MHGDLDSAKASEATAISDDREMILPSCRIHFAILSAKSLPSQTSTCCFPERPLNPFAVFSYKNLLGKTPVESGSSAPLWNMDLKELGVLHHDSQEFLTVKVYDRAALGKRKLIGSVPIAVARLLEAGEGNHQRWLKIYKEADQMQKTKISVGEVLIKFRNDRI